MVYFISGFPVSGKSTIAKALASEIGYEYFSTGDYARSLGMGVEASIVEKDLSDTFNQTINNKVINECMKNIVIDGFPRSLEQFYLIKNIKKFKIIFIVANPLIIFDRVKLRHKQEHRKDDILQIVQGRLKASNNWRRILCKVYPSIILIHADEVDIELCIEKIIGE